MEHVAIVGFGLAGAAMAASAPEGVTITAYDEGTTRCSSHVATGLVNPIVLKRRRVVWRATEALAAAVQAYPASFRSSEPIFEVLNSIGELNDWHALSDHPALGAYLGRVKPVPSGVHGLALGEVRGSFRLQVRDYLQSVRQRTEVCAESVQRIEPRSDGRWLVNEAAFDAVILAEGYQARWAEHFFGDLGMARTWGQGVQVKLPFESHLMLHRSHFLLPEPTGWHQLGASYGWGIDRGDQDPPQADSNQTHELIDSALEWVQGPIEVLGTWTGIRPNTKDRRPRWGWHPELPGLGLLNGLGSRGTLYAPLLAQELWATRNA